MEDFCECVKEGCVGAGWHRADNDGVEVLNVRNKNVLHIIERMNRKRPSDIRVHGASRGIRKGGKAKHVVCRTCFVNREHVVDLGACQNNVWVVVASGGNVGTMTPHMAFVGGGRLGQMIVNQSCGEARDCSQLCTLGEGKQECDGCWGTKCLMYVACILGC